MTYPVYPVSLSTVMSALYTE